MPPSAMPPSAMPPSARPVVPAPAVHTVRSADGTEIGYELRGSGPALVLVQGTMGTAYNFRDLADALAGTFTVVLPDRRGRGYSGPGRSPYALDREIEDLACVLEATGAHHVFGLSSGAIIALWAARRLPAVRAVAAYEPPLFPSRESLPHRALAAFDAAIAAGRLPTALVLAMKAGQFAPRAVSAIPTPVLAPLVGLGLRREAKHPPVGYATMTALAPALADDFALLREVAGRSAELRDVAVPALLLGGSRSQAYLRRALDLAAGSLPAAGRVELPGLDHGAAWNADRRGNPAPVAAELTTFFTTLLSGGRA
jgi:pimeloyl-ACP methyl ester carboxylesterase